MSEKKPYTSPKIFRVELNHDQAILGACSLSCTSNSTGSTRACETSGCRRRNNAAGKDNSAPPS